MEKANKSFFYNFIIIIIPILIIAGLYLLTACRTIFVGDSPELSAAIFSNGVAHPPGYPLYTTIGFIVCRLIYFILPNIEFAFISNFFSALLTLAGLFVFSRILELFKMTEHYNIKFVNIAVFFSILLLGTTTTIWEQSLITEVYTFEFFLTMLFFYILIKVYLSLEKNENFAIVFQEKNQRTENKKTKSKHPEKSDNIEKKIERKNLINIEKTTASVKKSIFAGGFLFGLCLTHRPIAIILLITAGLVLYFNIKKISAVKSALAFILGAAIGLFPLILMIIKSLFFPAMNWGNPTNLALLIEHFSGKLYHTRLFALPPEKVFSNLLFFIKLIFQQHFFLYIIFSAAGVLWLWKRYKNLLIILTAYQLLLIFYSINYDIPDINAYYIPVFAILFIYFYLGIFYCADFIKKHSGAENNSGSSDGFSSIILVYIVLFVIAIAGIFKNYKDNDISKHGQPENYITNIIDTTPKNSMLILSGDDIIGSFQYMQIVKKKRLDIAGVAMNFDRYEWYYKQLKKRYPQLKIPIYANDSNHAMSKKIVEANFGTMPIMCMYSREGLIENYTFTPCGVIGFLTPKTIQYPLLYTIDKWKTYNLSGFENYKIGKPINSHTDLRFRNIWETYCNTAANLAVYYLQKGEYQNVTTIAEFIEKNMDSKFPQSFFIRGVAAYNQSLYKEALQFFETTYMLSPNFENIGNLITACNQKIGKKG